jgi:hypothetical protein
MYLHVVLADYTAAVRRADMVRDAATHQVVRSFRQSRQASSRRRFLRMRRGSGDLIAPATPTLPAPAALPDRPVVTERRAA